MTPLPQAFFERHTCTVAQELLGKVLVWNNQYLFINEREAYHGFDDPASHAYRGKTKRTAPLLGPADFSYVYLIYGMSDYEGETRCHES